MSRVGAAAFVVGALVGACGATDEVAPEQPPQMRQCRAFELLMPRFMAAISTGRTQNLKSVVENQLLKTARPDDPPPLNDVLRVIFTTLNALASKPPEPGGSKDAYCAPSGQPPPLNLANEVCEVRRALEVMVNQGKGLDAVRVIEPQLQGVADYLTGTGSSADQVPHYEVSAVLSTMCSNRGACLFSNALDLIIAFTDYSNTPAGKTLARNLNALGEKESLKAFLAPQSLTEDGFVAIGRALITAIQGADPVVLQTAFDQLPLPMELKVDLRPIVDDLKLVVQTPSVIRPSQRALNCLTVSDPNADVLRMLYRLAIRDDRDEFGITVLAQVFQQLQEVDQRGSLVYLINTLAKAVRSDELAVDATATTCRLLFSTTPPAGQVRSNAELALPVIADLLRNGFIQESICAIDTLLFGCAGGSQPACQ